jgi:hypothetical protein
VKGDVMKSKVSHGKRADMISMPFIQCQNIQKKKIIANNHVTCNIVIHDLLLIHILGRYPDDSKLFPFNLWKREDGSQNRIIKSETSIDDAFIQLAGIISRPNDQRAAITGCFNLNSNFLLNEKKEYVDYA